MNEIDGALSVMRGFVPIVVTQVKRHGNTYQASFPEAILHWERINSPQVNSLYQSELIMHMAFGCPHTYQSEMMWMTGITHQLDSLPDDPEGVIEIFNDGEFYTARATAKSAAKRFLDGVMSLFPIAEARRSAGIHD